jgi:hypothetical protein
VRTTTTHAEGTKPENEQILSVLCSMLQKCEHPKLGAHRNNFQSIIDVLCSKEYNFTRDLYHPARVDDHLIPLRPQNSDIWLPYKPTPQDLLDDLGMTPDVTYIDQAQVMTRCVSSGVDVCEMMVMHLGKIGSSRDFPTILDCPPVKTKNFIFQPEDHELMKHFLGTPTPQAVYSSTAMTLPGNVTNMHSDYTHSMAMVLDPIMGSKLWITANPSPNNLSKMRGLGFVQPELNSFSSMVDSLEGIQVRIVHEGHPPFFMPPRVLHGCISLTTGMHFGTALISVKKEHYEADADDARHLIHSNVIGHDVDTNDLVYVLETAGESSSLSKTDMKKLKALVKKSNK